MATKTAAIVLAAGLGRRMRSSMTKVLHPALGRPMVIYPVEAALWGGAQRAVVVVGHQDEAVREVLGRHLANKDVVFANQPEPRGTGHAVLCGLEATEGFDRVLILCGDTPALDVETTQALLKTHETASAHLTVATFQADDPTGYGRLVRDSKQRVTGIVEHRDADDVQRAIREVNAGLYCVGRDELAWALQQIGTENSQGEMYLTDVVALLAKRGATVATHRLPDPTVVAGVNDRAQLAAVERYMRLRRNHQLMQDGVTMRDPESVRVETSVNVGRDTVLGAGVELYGRTIIGEGTRIDAGCVVTDCVIGDNVHLKPYVVATGAMFDEGAALGPFAHARPGTHLRQDAKVGNFVETKKAVIGVGSKASHLTYLGDCEVGARVNIGAGTITCNYDGVAKHQTIIEDGVFIGSDTQLVAPVRVGANATIGAGTTVTGDVPDGALVLSRAAQVNREGYYERHRRPREEAKRRKDQTPDPLIDGQGNVGPTPDGG